jgi:uncharacterized protein YjdB
LCRPTQLYALSTYTDTTNNAVTFEWHESNNVVWSSVSPDGVFPNSTDGKFTVITQGATPSATATLTTANISGSQAVNVNPNNFNGITLTSNTTKVPLGNTIQLNARALRDTDGGDDITDIVTWSHDNSGFATVNDAGIVTGVNIGGPTIISATCGGSTPATKNMTVVQAKELSRVEIPKRTGEDFYTVKIGNTEFLTAIAHYSDGTNKTVTTDENTIWSLVDITGSPLKILPTKGEYQGISEGVAEITAKYTENNITFSGNVIVKVIP